MLSCQRDLFHLPEGLHYLNCAYMSPLLKRVEEAGIAGVRRRRNPTSLTPADFFSETDRARRLFAELVNAPEPSRISMVPGVSYAMATVARNLRVRRTQNVVVAHAQFPSNVYEWRRLCADTGASLRTVSPPEGSPRRGEEWNMRLLEAIDADTALVALGNVHWADGTRFDLERMGKRAREVGAALVVDGTQSVGALPLDVQRVQPDVLVCGSYKWMMGPYSLGLAYYGPRFDGGVPLEQTWLGRRGSEDFTGLVNYVDEYQPGAARYDVSERSNFTLMPMLVAALEQLLEWRPERVQQYCRELTRGLRGEARALGYTLEDEAWCGAHLFGIRLPKSLDLPRLQQLLRERRVFVSVRGDAVRVSPNVYNDQADVQALADVLRAAAS
jgi:selenocysteine lyase/cysteine desulfurase